MRDTPEISSAMAFTDVDLGSSTATALSFAGEGGRMATLPDIIDARLARPDDSIAWRADITTSSIEYVGLSRGGTPVAAVAHGIGPLADPDFLAAAASVVEDLERGTYRIPDDEFHALLDGHFGHVDVYDIREAVRRREFHLQQPMTMKEAVEDPMVRARLGERCEEFLKVHHRRSRDWRDDRDLFGHDGNCIVQMRDPRNYSYFLLEGIDTGAAAHPLRISGAYGCRHCHFGGCGPDDHTCLVTSVGCHPWKGRATVVGARAGDIGGRIHPGIDAVRAWFSKHYPLLYRKNARRPARLAACALVNMDGRWFTQHPRVGTGIDKRSPHYKAYDVELIRAGIELTLPYRGNVHELVYDQEELVWELPAYANAYHIVDEPNPRWLRDDDKPSHVTVHIDAYRVRVDTRWYIPTMEEVRKDFERVLKFPSALPQHLA